MRSLIGSEKQHLVYFPTGSDNRHIQRLNTTTNETETIKILPFQPRCLVVKNGWVCCGGETGEFAAIRSNEDDSSTDQGFRLPSEPDARLPMDFDTSGFDDIFPDLSRLRSNKGLVAESKRFGRQRVNCVTLWFPPSSTECSDFAYTRPVAVLSNNDKTVTIVRLQDQQALDEVTYPDCVNRAVISPDGRLLIAICDDPYLYVHERMEKRRTAANRAVSAYQPAHEWVHRNRIHLRSQRKQDRSDNRGSFAACFSNSTRYLAVGTQYGAISIFDATALNKPELDPLITTFTSSRPNLDPGAIREMAFAPGPIELLAWTEDRGRIGVADLRSHFISRQIVNLNEPDHYDHISVIDRSSIDPRLLDQRGERHENLPSSLTSGLDLSSESRRLRTGTSLGADHYNEPLRREETAVLEALQDFQRRRLQRTGGQATPGTRLPLDRGNRSTLGSDNSRSRERSASVSRAVNEIMGNHNRDHSERPREAAPERLRLIARPDTDATDRRRSGAPPPPRRTGGLANTTTASEAEGSRVTRRPLSRPNPAALSGWVDLEVLQHDFPYDNLLAADGESRNRDRSALLAREWEDNPYRRFIGLQAAARASNTDPYDTSGLSWSEDGQTL